MLTIRVALSKGCLLILLLVVSPFATGQSYPSKPIRIITGGVGGGGDFTARLIAQEISASLGQPVIVDNRPTGIIPGQVVSQAPPDGYTLLVASSLLWIGPLSTKTPYDPIRDFLPITMTEISPSPVVVHPSLPVKSLKELIALAKAKPGELNYGATAVGAGSHLAGELFKSMAGVNIVGVIYSRGAGTAMTALIGGETQVQFGGGVSSMPHVKSGRLRALAVTSKEPSVLFPGLPTVAASGVPGYEAVSMTGVLAPAKTSKPIIDRLNQEIVRALSKETVRERFIAAGAEPSPSSSDQTAATIKVDLERWSKVIKDIGLRLE